MPKFFRSYFGKCDNFIISFQNFLTFRYQIKFVFYHIRKYSNFISFVANSLILEPIMQCKLHNWFSLSFTFSGPFDFPAIRQRPKMLLPPSFLLSLSCILSPILVNCEKWSPLLHHHHHQLEDLTAQESRLGWTNEYFLYSSSQLGKNFFKFVR